MLARDYPVATQHLSFAGVQRWKQPPDGTLQPAVRGPARMAFPTRVPSRSCRFSASPGQVQTPGTWEPPTPNPLILGSCTHALLGCATSPDSGRPGSQVPPDSPSCAGAHGPFITFNSQHQSPWGATLRDGGRFPWRCPTLGWQKRLVPSPFCLIHPEAAFPHHFFPLDACSEACS